MIRTACPAAALVLALPAAAQEGPNLVDPPGFSADFAPDAGGDVEPDNDGGAMLTAQPERDFEQAGTLTSARQVGVGAGRLLSFDPDPQAANGPVSVRAPGS